MRRRPHFTSLVVILALSLALLLLSTGRTLAQTNTPGPLPTFTPPPTLSPTPQGPLASLRFIPIDQSSDLPRLSIEIERRENGEWPTSLQLVISHPDSVRIERAELDAQEISPAGDSQATQTIYMLPAPAQATQATRRLALSLLIGARTIGDDTSIRVELIDPLTGPLDDQTLPESEMGKLVKSQPSEPTSEPKPAGQQEEPDTPVATEAPAVATNTPPPPAATAPPTETATPVPETAGTFDGISGILWAVLIGAIGLLFLAIVAYILYRILRRPTSRASQPIAMRPQPETPPAGQPATPASPSADAAATVVGAAAVAGAATQIAAAPLPPAPPYLTLAEDADARFDIVGERFTIGRGDANSLQIGEEMPEADTVSRFHAVIYRQNDRYVIEDLNSHNGVWVNEQAIPKITLEDGARIGIGAVAFIYHAGSARAQSGGKTP